MASVCPVPVPPVYYLSCSELVKTYVQIKHSEVLKTDQDFHSSMKAQERYSTFLPGGGGEFYSYVLTEYFLSNLPRVASPMVLVFSIKTTC